MPLKKALIVIALAIATSSHATPVLSNNFTQTNWSYSLEVFWSGFPDNPGADELRIYVDSNSNTNLIGVLGGINTSGSYTVGGVIGETGCPWETPGVHNVLVEYNPMGGLPLEDPGLSSFTMLAPVGEKPVSGPGGGSGVPDGGSTFAAMSLGLLAVSFFRSRLTKRG